MFKFLHEFSPEPILISFGSLKVHWYGLFISLGILLAITIALRLGQYYKIDKNKIFDLAFWTAIVGVIGARTYAVFLDLHYYLDDFWGVFKVWEGGLAIHGAVFFGALTVIWFAKKEKIDFWILSSIIVPGLALGQAIGRWGNYFNQELFGFPTSLPFGIPIDVMHRPAKYLHERFFHPAFLYESIGNFLIFLVLISMHFFVIKKKRQGKFWSIIITSVYLILYSLLRFIMEYIRIEDTQMFLGIRFPQFVSLVLIAISFAIIFFTVFRKEEKKED